MKIGVEKLPNWHNNYNTSDGNPAPQKIGRNKNDPKEKERKDEKISAVVCLILVKRQNFPYEY